MKKALKRIFGFAVVFFGIISLLFIGLIIRSSMVGTFCDSLQECINSRTPGISATKIIYSYENDKEGFAQCMNSNNEEFYVYFKKMNWFGKTKYNFNILMTIMIPEKGVHDRVFRTASRNIYYIYLDEEHEIEEVDCCGYTPIGQEISYEKPDGTKRSCWIFVIDRTKDPNRYKKPFTNVQ